MPLTVVTYLLDLATLWFKLYFYFANWFYSEKDKQQHIICLAITYAILVGNS